MPIGIKDRIALYKINERIKEVYRLYTPDLKKMEKTGNREEYQMLQAEFHGEMREYEEQKDTILTRYYLRKLEKMGLPKINYTDDKIYENHYGYGYLTREGIYQVRKVIRNEWKERLDLFGKYATIIFGFMGMLIGLIAIWKG